MLLVLWPKENNFQLLAAEQQISSLQRYIRYWTGDGHWLMG